MAVRIKSNIDKLSAAAREAARAGNAVLADSLARRIQQNIQRRTRRRTGALSRAVRVREGGVRGQQVVVGTGAPYWAHLENGTRHIRARRFVADAIRQTPQTVRTAEGVMRETIRRNV